MVQMLQYRSYRGSIVWSAEDSVLHGNLLGLRSMITYEGAEMSALESNFQAAVDEYLAFCAAEKLVPELP